MPIMIKYIVHICFFKEISFNMRIKFRENKRYTTETKSGYNI